MTVETKILPPTDDAVARAAQLLRAGRLVSMPTETVYGLAADATSDQAVAAIFAAKNRPTFNPLISHVPDLAAVEELAVLDDRAHRLAERFWPGPLTLVLPRRDGCPVSLLATAGLDSIAVRMPSHPVALALLRATGRPVAAPSANPSGGVSPTTAEHVAQGLAGRVDLVLDGGACQVGVESTVLDLTTPTATLLRPGGVTREQLEAVIGPVALADGHDENSPRSPGMLRSHYAPSLPVRLNADSAEPGEALLAFGPAADAAANLSESGDLAEAAANLFAMLRSLDHPGLTGIAVMPIPEQGLGMAINDRLRRAAAPR